VTTAVDVVNHLDSFTAQTVSCALGIGSCDQLLAATVKGLKLTTLVSMFKNFLFVTVGVAK
jgi:hypothetical protein